MIARYRRVFLAVFFVYVLIRAIDSQVGLHGAVATGCALLLVAAVLLAYRIRDR